MDAERTKGMIDFGKFFFLEVTYETILDEKDEVH